MAWVMPVSTVMNGGIGSPGLTRVPNSPSCSPPRTFTAPISVIPQPSGAPPVVSRSSTTNVVVRSWAAPPSASSASKLSWMYAGTGAGGWDGWGCTA